MSVTFSPPYSSRALPRQGPQRPSQVRAVACCASRRHAGVAFFAAIAGSLVARPAAADIVRNQPLPDSDPYIQDLVRKSQEMAEQRRQERLANYYKRNFKEYFEFEGGLAARARGISPETTAKMKQWLKDNQ